MASNIMLVVFMIIVILLLFTVMIFSAMASDKTKDCDANTSGSCDPGAGQKCHKNSMYAALITGIATGILAVCLIIYIYSSKDLKSEVHSVGSSWLSKLSPEQVAAIAKAE